MLDNIADGLVVTDVEGQILMHNPVFLEMVAGLPPDCLEEPCIIDEDQPDLVGQLLRQVSRLLRGCSQRMISCPHRQLPQRLRHLLRLRLRHR